MKRVDRSLNLIVLYVGIFSLIGSLIFYILHKSFFQINFNIAVGVSLLIIYILRNKLTATHKILTLMIASCIWGTISLYYSGYYGAGMIVFILVSLYASAFLTKRKTVIFYLSTIVVLTLIPVLLIFDGYKFPQKHILSMNNPLGWFVQILVYLLYLVVMNMAINSMKSNLADSVLETKEHQSQIYKLAYYDQTSGLPNKYKMFEELGQAVNLDGWMVLFGIKEFDLINSIHGHEIGDKLIKCLSTEFNKFLKTGELLARTKENEFMLYYTAQNHEDLKDRMSELFHESGKKKKCVEYIPKVHFYCGYFELIKPCDLNKIYQKASLALEQAKLNKTERIVYYSKQIEEAFRREEEIKNLLPQAIENKEFYISYQEKVANVSNITVGLEALARWSSPVIGDVFPNEFIPIIEKSSYNKPFGNMIVTMVLHEYQWLCKKFGENVNISINISPLYLTTSGFVEFIDTAASKHGVNPKNIILEITEDSLVENIEQASIIFSQLRKKGYKISLDDFGTGYSSLNYLSSMEVDELKIDKTFIDRMCEDKKTSILIQTIINLKDTYGFNVVAEGVESKEQCDHLKGLGCDLIQGFYYSRPTPLTREE